jgi:glycerophosphoryl diester phosphodiesterase
MNGEVDYFSLPRPRLFGHRGAAGVAPENTLPSFRRALEEGAAYLELDVHGTRDGAVVVIHDDSVDRTTDGSGPVRELSLSELRQLDAGYRFESDGRYPYRGLGIRIPTLEEVLVELPGVPLNVEIKQVAPAIEEEVARLLARHRSSRRVLLAAEDHRVMERIRRCAPQVATSASADEARDFFERCFSRRPLPPGPPYRALQVPPRFGGIELLDRQIVEAAHSIGVELHVWTLNEETEIERCLELGVDGVMSDFPARLVQVASRLARRGS